MTNPARSLLSLLAWAGLATAAGAADPPARYLALGDSYTIGEGVAESDRWPVQLAAGLTAGGTPCAPPRIIARTGWTTDEMLGAVDQAFPPADAQPVFDLVTLLIGVNDQYRGRSADAFTVAFPHCLDRAIGLAGGRRDHVVVVAIPDYGMTPFGAQSGAVAIGHAIDAFDAIVKQQSPPPLGYADILPVSRDIPAHRDWVAGDGLHPTGVQYAAWTAVILPLARAALLSGHAAPAAAPAP